MVVSIFYIMAGIRVITAVVHLVRFISSGFNIPILIDVIFNLAVAALAVVCAGMVKRRNVVVILAFAGMTIITIAFAVSMGRGFNFGVIALAAFYLLCLWVLRRRSEIV